GYIIEHEGKPAGYGIISEKFETEVGGITVWIEDVYVKSEYRGRGLGGEFLSFLIDNFKGKAKRLRLDVEDDNTAAIGLYKKFGFDILPYQQMICDI
ncbi:MAG: GNAT family N-acetyltransferase, partial [Clostridiales bacterium]|nr:GNAT family N-acetyltransferase [Clostridiales bacterium]